MKVFVGIDPGLDGGIAILKPGGNVSVTDMPTLKAGTKGRRVIDTVKLARIFQRIARKYRDNVMIGYEEGIAMPKQSSQSTAKSFRGLGILEGMIAALDLPALPPFRSSIWKKDILHGLPKEKDSAILYVQRKYPNVELVPKGCRKPRDGRADAICIAEYTRSRT